MGGSGSSGGSSGAVDYPAYMKTQHEAWLTAVASDITTAQFANPYSTAVAYDPDCVLAASNYILSVMYDFISAVDYDGAWESYYDIYKAKFTNITLATISPFSFTTLTFDEQTPTPITAYTFATTFDAAHVTALISSFQTDLESRRDTDFKPAYKVGMQNVNAVMSSAFTIGDALITAQVARDVASFSAELNFKNEEKLLQYDQAQAQNTNDHNSLLVQKDDIAIKQAIAKGQFELNYDQMQAEENTGHNKNLLTKDQLAIEQERMSNSLATQNAQGVTALWDSAVKNYGQLAALTIDANRIKIVAKQEEYDKNLQYDRKDAVWDLEMYQYGGNVLASIAGAAIKQNEEVSTGSSVLGGALAGAAAGAVLGPVGALSGGAVAGIGAALGGLGGLFG